MYKSGLYRFICSAVLLLMHFIAEAQESVNKIGMADAMRESGKIYVVVGVLLIIFLGFIAFLIMTDRKISKLEKEIKAK